VTADLRARLDAHHVLIKTDNPFQQRARLLQALWREEEGLPVGEHRGGPLGSRLAMPDARERLTNYLTDTIRQVVRREVLDPERSRDKLYGQPRIWNDLLSSQPMCFNLFGELQADLGLASRVFAKLLPGRVARVTAIEFEHSPGRGDPRYTGDRSAFDVFIRFETPAGPVGFIGIEVKYHEDLDDPPAPHRPRYDEIAAKMRAFKPEASERLKAKPLQQVWRDHLLAGSLLHDGSGNYADGLFVFLYPEANLACAEAVRAYRSCLTNERTFEAWTLEAVVAAVRVAGAGSWIDEFARRYLGFGRL
jgi:hypothetical protein